MHPARTSLLRSLYTSRRNAIFSRHVRIANSIFRRPCSCTANLAAGTEGQLKTAPPADHRKLAVAQKLFTTSPYSPGSPLFLPNGAEMFIKLTNLLRGLYPQFGFREVITPTIYKQSLWEKSGHWENYAEHMFEVRGRGASGQKRDPEIGEDEAYGLKAMNCPGHCLLFASEQRSYRDLPIRYADFSALHRNEISGALSGLTRVRRFHQDDGHIFCRPSQIEEEIRRTMEFIELIYTEIFDLGPYRLVLSTRPHGNYIGAVEEWDAAENQLKAALARTGRQWSINEGDGAFYGPKIDIILKDTDGKEHQTATIQLDFQLPRRFGLEYIAPSVRLETRGEYPENADRLSAGDELAGPVTPIIIHRAILGSLERFLALLVEHYNGCYPFWISPRPAIVVAASNDPNVHRWAQHVAGVIGPGTYQFTGSSSLPSLPTGTARELIHIHVDVDVSDRSLSKKVALARQLGYNFILTVGPKEVQNRSVAVAIGNQRRRSIASDMMEAGIHELGDKRRQISMALDEAIGYFAKLRLHHM